MDNKATTKRMIGAVVLVLVAALLLAWLLKGKNRDGQQDMAMNQTGESKPILGFPGLGGDAQKPSLLGEDQNAAAQNQQQQPGIGMTGMDAAQQQAAAGNNAQQQQGGSLIPGVEVKMPGTAQNTTGFDVRPGGEVRDVVDTDGKVKDGTGSMGTGDAKPDAGKTADAGQGATAGGTTAPQGQQGGAASQPAAGGTPSASQQDKPAATPEPEKKSGSKVVLVNEKPVPRATSTESASAKAAKEAAAKEAAAKEAAAKKAAAEAAAKKAAADKAAADKSKELANAGGAAGGFSIQVLASADKAKADAVAAPLKADGYKVAVATASVGGKTIYRVSVGGFADRAAADSAQAKMKSRYKQNQAIQGSFVTSGK